MNANIRLGKISSIDYAKGMARVVYHEKDDDVTRLIPLLSHDCLLYTSDAADD